MESCIDSVFFWPFVVQSIYSIVSSILVILLGTMYLYTKAQLKEGEKDGSNN